MKEWKRESGKDKQTETQCKQTDTQREADWPQNRESECLWKQVKVANHQSVAVNDFQRVQLAPSRQDVIPAQPMARVDLWATQVRYRKTSCRTITDLLYVNPTCTSINHSDWFCMWCLSGNVSCKHKGNSGLLYAVYREQGTILDARVSVSQMQAQMWECH